MRHLAIILFSLSLFSLSFGQTGKKVQFVGGARSILTNSNLQSDGDTVTAPRSAGGYALLDLGVKINPNKNTEILGMVRINNAFGGFWGAGVTFDVRQLYVRGVAKDFLLYQLGTIDYKLTPYTFYNHNADLLSSANGILKMKEDVLNYETFYKNNTWRQQGASVNFGIQFPKVLEEVMFNGFITRLNPSDFTNVLERLYGGGNMVIKQSKYLDIGINHASAFDLAGTALDSNVYKNHVSTVSYDIHKTFTKFTLGLDGESGLSSLEKAYTPEDRLSDYFAHARAYINLKDSPFKFHLGYMNNGADFRSVGAQSKRLNFNQHNNFYTRYTNNQILRPISIYDMYNDPSLTNTGISIGIMDYNPAINNVLPYGIASFNRQGGYFGFDYAGNKEVLSATGKMYYLSEVRGQGTSLLKNFIMTNANFSLNLSKWWGLKKTLLIHSGITYQNTQRDGETEYEKVNLESILSNIALEYELIDQLFLLGNYTVLNAYGKDQLPQRDPNGTIINFREYTVSGTENIAAFGMRFDFSENSFLGIFYEMNMNSFVEGNPYNFNQASILYSLKF